MTTMHDKNTLSLISNMTYIDITDIRFLEIFDKLTIVDTCMFCSKYTKHIPHIRLPLTCEIAMRNPFSLSQSKIVYIYHP